VHLLDDGFQHLKLHRDLDIVLIDAENPWGRRGAFPSLLRESPAALARADAVLLTRCEVLKPREIETLRDAVQRWNPAAEFFTASTRVTAFRSAADHVPISADRLRSLRPFAFCGLGNPHAFFRTLDSCGIVAVGKKIFPDHHRYTAAELSGITKQAESVSAGCLLTTEKDCVNLRSSSEANLPLYWAEMDLEIEHGSRLLSWLCGRLDLAAPALPNPIGTRVDAGGLERAFSTKALASEIKLNRS
jgi:tetraacyldisaccharide 4'-kinase